MPPLVSPWNDVWDRSAEIPYWWRVTTQIWVVLLIGWCKFPRGRTNRKHSPDLGSDTSSVWNFCMSFARRHFTGKPMVASRNVGYCLKLCWLQSNEEALEHKLYVLWGTHGVYLSCVVDGETSIPLWWKDAWDEARYRSSFMFSKRKKTLSERDYRDRDGVLGCLPGYDNFDKVIFRGCI